eukprot:CAMPEP_0178896298 /NCGR_PEP_ID=MMETSP0786-20121207/1086_1 /TAXON_ID=186022 /ORGANISM="Thalassionema frauenfeldii, Strain CCMP 1798" /LENGTH=112 /DNA_ID=CAMNT_0020566667 /DNA_START=94 /DNA_END=429 /DNA_ORIENTATION=+
MMKSFLVIFSVFVAAVTADNIIAERYNTRHEKRMEKLSELISERKQQLTDHESGHRRLSSEEHSRILRQKSNFQKKLEQLQSMTKEEIDEMVKNEVEAIHRMDAMEYLDFEW